MKTFRQLVAEETGLWFTLFGLNHPDPLDDEPRWTVDAFVSRKDPLAGLTGDARKVAAKMMKAQRRPATPTWANGYQDYIPSEDEKKMMAYGAEFNMITLRTSAQGARGPFLLRTGFKMTREDVESYVNSLPKNALKEFMRKARAPF